MTTVNVIGLPVPVAKAPPDPVAEAVMVTEPAVVPVTVNVATPPVALTEVKPETLPAPLVFANATLKLLSGPVVIVLPAVS